MLAAAGFGGGVSRGEPFVNKTCEMNLAASVLRPLRFAPNAFIRRISTMESVSSPAFTQRVVQAMRSLCVTPHSTFSTFACAAAANSVKLPRGARRSCLGQCWAAAGQCRSSQRGRAPSCATHE